MHSCFCRSKIVAPKEAVPSVTVELNTSTAVDAQKEGSTDLLDNTEESTSIVVVDNNTVEEISAIATPGLVV